MFRKEVAVKPMLVWILCALSAPIVQLLAGYDWRSIGLTGLACTAVSCLVLGCDGKWNKWVSALQALWLLLALWACGHYVAASWPLGETTIIIPATIFMLTAWASIQGQSTAARMAGGLFVLLLIGYGLVLGAGLPQCEWTWISEKDMVPPGLAVFIFLLPASAVCMPRQKAGGKTLVLFAVPLISVLVAVITGGNMKSVEESDGYAFYEMCRNLSLFGLAERFEALVCALITVGWFSLVSYLFVQLGSQVQMIFPGKGKVGIWVAAVASVITLFINLTIDNWILALGAVIFWVFAPLLSQGIGFVKKRGKK